MLGDDPCATCTRRTVLHGLGIALVVSACGGGGDQAAVDASTDADSCPTDELCIDVTKAPFTPLANVAGSVAVKTAHDTIVLVRTTATDIVALSAICTHQGCTVAYKSASNLLACPCHGAEYALSGAVVRSFDVLLTHEPPLGAAHVLHPKYADAGSPEVAELLRLARPAFHFCGHYHEPGQRLASDVESYQLNAVNFLRADRLNPGCIAILEWNDRSDARVELLDPPWLREYTRHSWRHL